MTQVDPPPSSIGDFAIGYSRIGDTGRTGWAIVQAVYEALLRQEDGNYPTVAGARVYLPRDWPVTEILVPILKLHPPKETKESLGKAGIQFDTTVSVTLEAEVSSLAAEDNVSAGKVLTALALIQREIELAVIGDPILFGGDFPGLVENLRSVQVETATNSMGKRQRGGLQMIFEFGFYQGTEDFRQPKATEFDRLHLYADLINVADPSGTYPPPMQYVPTPAPRTDGPDGRIEGEVDVTFPPQ